MSFETMLHQLDSTEFIQIHETRTQLIEMGSSIVPQLVGALDSATNRQALNIIYVLSAFQDDLAISALKNALLNHKSMVIRSNAAEALGKYEFGSAKQALLQSLQKSDETEMVLMWTLTSLGNFHDREVVDALLDFLDNTPSATKRYLCIRALGNTGFPDAVDKILPYLHDEDHHVRTDAASALKKLGYIATD